MLERYVVVESDLNQTREQHLEDVSEKFAQMKNFETDSVCTLAYIYRNLFFISQLPLLLYLYNYIYHCIILYRYI